MRHRYGSFLIAAMFVLTVAATSSAQEKMQPEHYRITSPEQAKWNAAPPSLPAGAQVALLEGDPSQAGDFTMRLKMPDGYQIPPHHHPKRERVTVVSGTFNVGMGDKWDDTKLAELRAGTYAYINPGSNHFAKATGETVIQLHGVGPWSLVYANPADDPRKK
jgi:quercetin dioxygenase-like cupin family protein